MNSKLSAIAVALPVAVLVVVLALSAEALPAAAVLQNPKAPEFVVKFGNKSFYKYDDELVNWFGARDLCKFFSLEIAEFTNGTEWEFLRSNFRQVEHWIGASVKGVGEVTDDSFEWTSSKGAISRELPLIHWSEHFICVYADGGDHLFTDFCLSGRHKTLCQSFS